MREPKTLRVFAGPNGSGKSTLYKEVAGRYPVQHFINSDELEKELAESGAIKLKDYDLYLTQEDFDEFLLDESAVSLLRKADAEGYPIAVSIRNNTIEDDSEETHSYEASLITSFIRKHLIEKELSYSFETVMSHPSKLAELRQAKANGYKTYLYFVCLEKPSINVTRVKNRVREGGHHVPTDKIIQRYERTLENLYEAIRIVDKSYIFDNSGDLMVLLAEFIDGQLTIRVSEEDIPKWFVTHVLEKL